MTMSQQPKVLQDVERRIYAGELRADGDGRKVRGYAAVFGSESEGLGWFVEEIAPGAFDNVLGDDVRALVNHDDNKILARTKSETLTIGVDRRGLFYEFEAPDTSYANDLLVSIRRGDISQSSFGFQVEEDKWEDMEMVKDGKKWFKAKRTILKVARLYDVSPVTYPAYPDTSVALRKFDAIKASENRTEPDKDTKNENGEPQQGLHVTEQERLTRALHILKLKQKMQHENS